MDYLKIYQTHADAYDRLVNAEDCDQQLLPAIERLVPLRDAMIMEAGAGTGRISRQLVKQGAQLVAIDLAPAMLKIAQRHLQRSPSENWTLAQADGRFLPVKANWADLAIAGWVFGHLRSWLPNDWRTAIGQALDEMSRTLKPNGVTIIIETLGTGSTEPQAPDNNLAEYYAWLETSRGFKRVELRTDYLFESVEQAAEITGFFFGDSFAERVHKEAWTRVPECTGLWWKRQ